MYCKKPVPCPPQKKDQNIINRRRRRNAHTKKTSVLSRRRCGQIFSSFLVAIIFLLHYMRLALVGIKVVQHSHQSPVSHSFTRVVV
jgi:hypothetical protein